MKLQVIAETLEQMEAWERVLLRCRALDVSYDDIATYTGRPARQLKTYHARTKKKFLRLLAQHYPEVVET
jgi:DNA-directed RNA polymerase specialized sigma24 family protein